TRRRRRAPARPRDGAAGGRVLSQELAEADRRRPEDDSEERREDEERDREPHLHWCLARTLLGDRPALVPNVGRLVLERLREREPELLALHERADERRHLRRVEPLRHRAQR